MKQLDAAAAIVLLEFQKSYGLGFVAPNGRIVTCFHVVADEGEIVAHLADGRVLPVQGVCALDTRRDLAVLDVGLLDATPIKPAASGRLAEEGQPVFLFGMVPSEGRTRWVDAQLASLQVIGASLTVYSLTGEIPADASGGPLMGADGSALGVVTVAETESGAATLAVPWRYLEPLLRQNQELPLSALLTDGPAPHRREVPEHPLSLLEGSEVSGLEVTTDIIGEAIRLGAPAYNRGDVARCYAIYAETARRLIEARSDCAGVQRALRAGLARAATMSDVNQKAWAMRDAFDGLLLVIEKFLGRSVGPAKGSGKPLLN